MKVFVYLFKLHRKLRKSLEFLTSYNRRDLKVKLVSVAINRQMGKKLNIKLLINIEHEQISEIDLFIYTLCD